MSKFEIKVKFRDYNISHYRKSQPFCVILLKISNEEKSKVINLKFGKFGYFFDKKITLHSKV